jgi:hypothetical protein
MSFPVASYCLRGPEETRASGTRKVYRSAAETQPKAEIGGRRYRMPKTQSLKTEKLTPAKLK